MARLDLFLLGPPRLERDGVPLQFDTRKIMALVAYLAVSGLGGEAAPVSRESLLALLWPDLEPERARAVLRRNLSLLRSALGGEWLVTDRQTVGTDPEADFWLDVAQFSRLVRSVESHDHPQEQVCPECLKALTEAVALYQGDFLEGFGLRDSIAYDDWQFFQADGLRRELAIALERLVRGYAVQEEYQAALSYARRWLALDPLHEPAHRQLMQLYAQAGQRSAAFRQYQECVRILGEELGLPPSAETEELYEQIRTSHSAARTTLGQEPARRLASPIHNLPAQTTPFVGREEELAELGSRLQGPACRLLTLSGPGGIGKTRLALRLAEMLLDLAPPAFEHGAFFVSLAPLQTAEGIVPAVAEALGYAFHTEVEGSARATPRQQLLDYLRGKQLLLILDNYEHLLVPGIAGRAETGDGGVGFVTDVLSSAPQVKVLVTSRASIQVQGEYVYSLAGLRVPDAELPIPADNWQALRGYSAIDLFVQGAQRARLDFELQPQDLAHVAQICRLVQGMPLGILLAAAWVELLSPEEIAAEIRQCLDFLGTDLRDVPLRQRSIRAVFDHSWRLLDRREQELFQGLSVFRGEFSRDAAQEVAGASLHDLMSLVNKSLLHVSSPGRYQVHELLRQYGAEQLDLAPEHAGSVRDRHCAYYVAALEAWAEEVKGPRQQAAMDVMDRDIENGRAAWYWAVTRQNVECLARAADGIWLYHDWRLRQEEGRVAFEAAARGLEALANPEAQRLRAKCLILLSSFSLSSGSQLSSHHLGSGESQPAIEMAEQGMALLRSLEKAGHDVRRELALALFHDARLKRYFCPDPLEAKQRYEQSVALYEEVGDRWGQARALAYLGWMAEQLGHFGEAQALCERSLAIRRELGDQRGMADAMLNLGIIAWVQGRLDEAHRLLAESLGIFRSLDDWIRMAQTIKSLGEVLIRRGLFDDGLILMEGSADIYRELGYAFGVGGLLPFQAEARVHLGLYEEARAGARQGAEASERARHRWGMGFAHFVRGLAALAEGANSDALSDFRSAIAAFGEVRQRENRGWALGPLGLAARQAGDTARAWQCVGEALQVGLDLGAFMPVIYGLPVSALLLADRGTPDRAVEVYACASRYGFVANSCWFETMIGQQIRAMAASLPAAALEAARERGQSLDWDEMAARLLGESNN